MSEKWTDNQKKAIDIRNTNVLVSAAAGSGKTAVLVERVIKMITDETSPVYINQLLISTFTKAAAAEMKERIYTALREKIAENPSDTYLRKQLVLLNQAQISTIHSFCTNLLRENFHKVGLRHDFKVADEPRLAALRNQAVNNVLNTNYVKGDETFFGTVDTFGGKKSDDGLVSIIYDLYFFADSLANPKCWLENCTNLEKNVPKFKECMAEYLKEKFLNIAQKYKSALDVIYSDPGLEPYVIPYETELQGFLDIAQAADDTNLMKEKVSKFEFVKTLPRKKKDADPQNAEIVKKPRNYAKKAFSELAGLCLYSDDDIIDDISKMKPFIEEICRLTLEFSSEYAALKREENVVDFSDLEHFAVKLLEENDDVCSELKAKYKEIFIDEYQDTNGVQAFLFEKLSNGSNLFMVGDIKQSIYGFRNSNPKYFLDKYKTYSAGGNSFGTNILLSDNFRSSSEVLDFVNSIFEKLMSEKIGDVDYNDEHRLVHSNTGIYCTDDYPEIHVVDCTEDDLSEEDPIKPVEAEAYSVADRINRLIELQEPEIFDKSIGKYRKAEYGDVAVLMRSTNKAADVFAKVFASQGIPVYTEDKGGYFSSIEIATVMSFLQIIENPLQDIPMLAVIRSPIYGLDDNLIASLRAEDRYDFMYNVLKKSDNKSAKDFIASLDEYISSAKYCDVDYIVKKIVYGTGYYSFVGGLPNGEKRMANLNLLCERAADYCSDGYRGLLNFTEYVKNMIESGKEYGSAKLTGENENAVTITTIHRSKGLEFPFVILADTSHSFNVTDFNKSYIYDEDLGFAVNIIDPMRNLKYVPFVKKAIAEKKRNELWSEEVRLLYVALTRAKYKLIITAAADSAEKLYDECSVAEITPYSFKTQNSYIKWILTAFGTSDILPSNLSVIRGIRDYCNLFPDKPDEDNTDYSEFYPEINKRLNFSYPHKNCKGIPSKRSISEITLLGDEVIHLGKITDLSDGLNAAQRGTMIHFVLQNLDLENVGSAESIKAQVDNMILRGMIKEEYASVIDTNTLFGFFSSDIGKRMLNSGQIYREFKFCVDLPSSEVGYGDDNETVLVQGVIDCCFTEDDEFVIIDYKTGSLQEKYKKQLELYAQCLSVATGKKVKETYIYPLI